MTRVGLLLLPQFQMLAYVLAIETLRIANKTASEPLFRWTTLTMTDAPVTATNGAIVAPDITLREAGEDFDLFLICASYHPLDHGNRAAFSLLRRLARRGAMLGGLDSGTFVLARLGLLDGHRAVLHHEALAGFHETWPDITVLDQLYCIDGKRLTCAGGTATADAMLAWLAQSHSPELAEAVATGLVHGTIRPMEERQLAAVTGDPRAAAALQMMRDTIAGPLPLEAIARRCGCSLQALNRAFKRAYGLTPAACYQAVRLDHARGLLGSTDLPVGEIALACGFSSRHWFSHCYSRRFGMAPGRHRKRLASPRPVELMPRPLSG